MLVRELNYRHSVERGAVVHLHYGRELMRVEEVHQGNADAEAKADRAWKRSGRIIFKFQYNGNRVVGATPLKV